MYKPLLFVVGNNVREKAMMQFTLDTKDFYFWEDNSARKSILTC